MWYPQNHESISKNKSDRNLSNNLDKSLNEKQTIQQNNFMENPSPSNSIAMGTANRINAYRKTIVLSAQRSNSNLNDSKNDKLRDSVLNLHKQSKTLTDLPIDQQLNDSKLEKNSYQDQLKDFDFSQIAQNLKETEQVIEILQVFEKNYFETKTKMNISDLLAIDADVTTQTLSNCYQIVQCALPDEIIRFDRDKIDQKLEKILNKVKQNNDEWNTTKGEFQAIHEPVINKDILTFKVDRIQKNLERQEQIIYKYPNIQKNIRENKQQLNDLKEAYEKFEGEIFKLKYAELQQVKKNTEEIIQKISEQKITLEAKIDAAKQLIECVVPLNKDQTQKLMNLQLEVSKIQTHTEQSMIKNKKLLVVVPSLQEKFDQISENMKYVPLIELQDMVPKSKKLQTLINNFKDWKEIFDQFQNLTNHDFSPIQFESQKILDESKNLLDQQAAQKKGEFDDIINQIQKLSKKIKQEASDQSDRLERFEKDLLSQHNSQINISDQDLFFLKKEVSKDKASLLTINGLVNEVLKNSLQIIEGTKNNQIFSHTQANNFTDNDFLNLKANLKVLQKQDSIDLPRVKQNIDQLENFSSKLLKNGLNDDNKKTQNQISKMKKNYEDLQKIIDNLNAKLMKNSKAIASLKDLFQNQDLDRDFQFKTKLDDILEKCAQEINSLEPIQDMNSLQVRKKEIIGGINSLVSQFNDNNKQVKQTSKDGRGESDVLDLVKKNIQIQKECDDLEKKITQAKEFAEEINNLLEQRLEVNFLKLQDEYENKNRLIDICDENFDKLNTKIQDDEDILNNEIEKLNQLIEKLEEISPLNQPLPNDADNQQFKQNIINFLEKARNLREELEEQKSQIDIVKDEMLMVVQPLNELSERPVFIKDVQNIYDKLQQLTTQLTIIDNESTPKHFRVQQIMKQVEETLEQGKNQKINEIEIKYNEFDDTLNQLLQEKKIDEDNLAKLNQLIDFALKDPILMNDPVSIEKIRNAEAQQKQLEKDLRDIDAKIQDVLKKKIDTKKVVEDIKKNSKNFQPQQLQIFIQALDDQVDKIKINLEKTVQIKGIEIKYIEDMNNLIGERQQKAQALQNFNDIKDQVNDDLQALSKVLDQLPDQINKLLLTNLEMQKDSIDETCDYWEERKKIGKNIEVLSQIKPQIGKIKTDFVKYQNQFHHLQTMIKPTTGSDIVNKILNELKDLQSLVIDHVNQAVTISDDTEQIKHQIGDCEIPVNIQVRKNELQNFSGKLQNVITDFTEMKNTHQQNETDGDIGTTQIDIMLNSLQEKFKPILKEEVAMKEYLKKHLEAYTELDFTSYDNVNIIKEVLEFKKRIRDGLETIKQIEIMCNDLNTQMVQQDIDNAAHLLGKRTLKLKSRLLTASEVLKKISKAGNQMDGNTTHSEEDDFIEALKEEMPEVFKNIESNQANLDQIEKGITKVTQSKNIDLMASVKKQIDDLEKKVQQSESLALKLENEIIEWNAQKKLIRRDEEMIELTNICQEIKDDIKCEEDLMHAEYEKNCQKMKTEGDSSGELINMNKGIASYVLELEELNNLFISFNSKRETLYQKIDPELPKSVIDFRYKQKSNNKIMKNRKENPNAILWDKDIYYMITVNCKYRGPIHDLLKELRQINQIRKDLDVRYAKLKNDLVNFKPKGGNYKAVKGDLVDELFIKILNSVGINIPIKRLAAGKYLFGTRQIMAKIINGKLVIRVGGGYMSAEEFIEQYGAIELEKMMKAGTILEQPGQFDNALKGIEGGAISMAEMKQILKEQLFQVKLYTRDSTARESSVGNPFGQKQGTLLLNEQPQSLLQVEQNYDAIKFGTAATTKARHTKLSVSPMRTSKRNQSPHGLTPNKNSRQ